MAKTTSIKRANLRFHFKWRIENPGNHFLSQDHVQPVLDILDEIEMLKEQIRKIQLILRGKVDG